MENPQLGEWKILNLVNEKQKIICIYQFLIEKKSTLALLHFYFELKRVVWPAYRNIPYFCSRFVVSLADSIGNRVRIPDSSRCCDGQSPATKPLKTKSFGKAAEARLQSEDLPQVAKQGFRELELGFYIYKVCPTEGVIFVLGIPTFFQKF